MGAQLLLCEQVLFVASSSPYSLHLDVRFNITAFISAEQPNKTSPIWHRGVWPVAAAGQFICDVYL